jgi:ribosomal protein S18 acetylase RimI-like enzyme
MQMIEIVEAISPAAIDQACSLFVEYAESIGIDLSFQGFEDELESLPGKYVPPKGGLFLAFLNKALVGCVALRPLDTPGVAELKRLYVRPQARGAGLGRSLTERAIQRAIDAGYNRIRLDTLSTMHDAQRLYRKMGFVEIPPYTFNPIPGAVYMELKLRP